MECIKVLNLAAVLSRDFLYSFYSPPVTYTTEYRQEISHVMHKMIFSLEWNVAIASLIETSNFLFLAIPTALDCFLLIVSFCY